MPQPTISTKRTNLPIGCAARVAKAVGVSEQYVRYIYREKRPVNTEKAYQVLAHLNREISAENKKVKNLKRVKLDESNNE